MFGIIFYCGGFTTTLINRLFNIIRIRRMVNMGRSVAAAALISELCDNQQKQVHMISNVVNIWCYQDHLSIRERGMVLFSLHFSSATITTLISLGNAAIRGRGFIFCSSNKLICFNNGQNKERKNLQL